MNTKTLKDWFTNLVTIFSIIGLFTTLYVGIWYIPGWIQETHNNKVKNAEAEILQSVKELVFNDTTYTLAELPSLVRAKEISLQEVFPLSINDILTKTEESFMEDKYLPLAKRKELIDRLERIKMKLPKESKTVKPKVTGSGATTIGKWLSIIGSIVAVMLGIFSTYIKFKSDKEKEAELQNEIHGLISETEMREFSYEFERNIEETLKQRPDIILEYKDTHDTGIGIVFSKDGKKYFVEAKYLNRGKMGLSIYYNFINKIKNKQGEAWLVYNAELTPMVVKQITDFNKGNKNMTIVPVKASTPNEFAEKLQELLPR